MTWAFAQAQEKAVDYVNLGATLIKDGYLQRAQNVLEKADISKPDFDFSRYYSLKGILWHRMGYPLISNIFLEESISRGQDNPSIYLYIARNHWSIQQYQAVIDALEKAGDAAKESEQMFVIKAEAYKQLGQFESAWAVLDEGISLFPEFARFYRQKFYYLLELGYFQTASEYAEKYLSHENYSANEYLGIAYSLRENGQYEQAAVLLEEAALKHADDARIIELLGQVYIDQEHYLMAALVFDWASIQHPQFAARAAALYLKTQQAARALQLNRRIIDQKEKFTQRLSIALLVNDYEALVTLVPSLKRYDLLSDEQILYAVGYAYFRIGDFNTSRNYLKQINDSRMFAKASVIFQQIELCENDPLECP